ncbi:cobalt ECF transporter T component CbiQ [Desulfotomaculum defluvii]
MEKSCFAIVTMAICILANSITLSILVMFIMIGATVFLGQVPLYFYLRLLLLPLTFLSLGTLSVAITTLSPTDAIICSWNMLGYPMGITSETLRASLIILSKSLGSVSCLFFLVLTTSMLDIIELLRRLKVPELVLELMLLIYRFLFVLWDNGQRIYNAQSARLGYASGKKGLLSMSMLVSSLLLISLRRSRELSWALDARGYNGFLKVLGQDFTYSRRNIIIICFIELFLILVAYKVRSIL